MAFVAGVSGGRIPSAVLPLIELITRFLSSQSVVYGWVMSDHFRSFIRISISHPQLYDKNTFILYNKCSNNERYKCAKKTVVFYTVSTCVFANHLYTINITFFIQSGEMCIEIWIWGFLQEFQNVETTGAQHRLMCPDQACYLKEIFYW